MISAQLYIYDPVKPDSTSADSYKEVEFFDFESIELVQVKQDIRDINKVFADFSRTFTVPASKNNNQIFKHFYNPNIYRDQDPEGLNQQGAGTPFDIRKRIDAELHINYSLFKKGRVQLQSTQMRGNKPYSYTLIFFGSTIKLTETLGDKTLDTLSALQAVKIPYTAANIASLMQNATDVSIASSNDCEDGIVVPLITSTSRLVYNSVDNTLDNNLFPHGNQKGIDFRDLKPALRVHAIILAIQKQYPNISFSQDFFTLAKTTRAGTAYYNNPTYAELFIWLNRHKGQIPLDITEKQILSFTRPVGSDERYMKLDAPFHQGNGIQVIEDTSKTEFFIGVDITAPSSTSMYNFVIKRDGQEFQRFDGLFGNKSPVRVESKAVITSLSPLTFDSIASSEILGANAPEAPSGNYTFYIESASAGQFDFRFTIKKRKPADVEFFGAIKTTRAIAYNGTITVDTDLQLNPSGLLPNNMKIIDFLGGLFKMFNLTVIEGTGGQLKIDTLDNFYNSGASLDITKYVDNTESTVSSALPYSEVEFRYEGLDTVFAEQFGEREGRTWGTSIYPGNSVTANNNQLLNIGEKYEVLVPFEHHQFNRLFDQDNETVESNKTSIQWGYAVDGSFNAYLGKPLLFYAPKQSGAGINPIELVAGGSSSTLSQYHIPSNSVQVTETMATKDSDSEPTPNIHFYRETNEYAFPVSFLRTLFLEYYENYIKQTFDISRRLFQIKAILPANILREISLADSLTIFDTEYRINKITSNLGDGRTNFELLNKTVDELLTDNVRDLAANVSGSLVTADNSIVTADLSQQIT